MKRYVIIIVVLATTGLSVSSFAQGSLTPPGAPAATMKTLEQVEPRIDVATVSGDGSSEVSIYNSGSYYLSANLKVTNNWGILVSAEDVTLDLNGFRIERTSGSGGAGIYLDSFANRVTVRNGSIRGFDHGIWGSSEGCVFERLAVSDCDANGIFSGDATRIRDCQVLRNPGTGIFTGSGSALSDCIASYNTGKGIYVFSGSLSRCVVNNNQGTHGIHVFEKAIMKNCSANGNGGIGIGAGNGSALNGCIASNNDSNGITMASGSTLTGCLARDNENVGIYTLNGSSLDNCTSLGNQSYGIYTYADSCLSGCSAVSNQNCGIYAGTGSTLNECSAHHNKTTGISADSGVVLNGCSAYENQGNGISVSIGSTLRGCSAYYNRGTQSSSFGIKAGSGSAVIECTARGNSNTNSGAVVHGVGISVERPGTVKDCTSSNNEGDGIQIHGDSLAEGNVCQANGFGTGSAGIRAGLVNNRIDNNTVTLNGRGIAVEDIGNIIVRNSASGNNTNYVIVSGNDVGNIQTTPVGAGAWDNFEF